ncbi:MAG: hypothetical protein WCI09_06460 [Planctomycetota bacterium]
MFCAKLQTACWGLCLLVWAGAWLAGGALSVSACPFCGVVGEPLAARRDAADCVAVGEALATAVLDATGILRQNFEIDQVLRGNLLAKRQVISARVEAGGGGNAQPAGRSGVQGTAILFCTAREADQALAQGKWLAIAANEAVLGYLAAAPAVQEPIAERLKWFAKRLEHPQPLIAEDAFREFGLAPFVAVVAAAEALDSAKLEAWVGEPGIDQRRRGFYGLALGVVASQSKNPAEIKACVSALHAAIEAPADDFRAGFAGVMAGVLVAEQTEGLLYLKDKNFFAPTARPVDQRHLLSALRFAWESLSLTIPHTNISGSTAQLLASPIVAADAVIDLARYQAWGVLDEVVALWSALGRDDALVRRAVAGYLTACPLDAAKVHLDHIRSAQPELWQRALSAAAVPGKQ